MSRGSGRRLVKQGRCGCSLSPLTIDERLDPVGPCTSDSGKRCRGKGFLAMSRVDYLKLLSWTTRHAVYIMRTK